MASAVVREAFGRFALDMSEQASNRRLADDLWKALRRGEFEVFYQPIVA